MDISTKAPHSELHETMILGTYLQRPDLQTTLDEELHEDLFLVTRHRSIIIYIKKYKFKTLAGENGDQPYTLEMMGDSFLRNEVEAKKCGGMDYLKELEKVNTAGWKNVLERLKDYATRRQIMSICESLFHACAKEEGTPVGDLVKDIVILKEYSSEHDKQRNLTREVNDIIEGSEGIITTTYVYNALHCVTKRDKTNIRQILRRIKKSGIIEATGKSPGQYRKIDKDYEFEDWTTSDESPVDINLPLGLTQYCEIYPGDIIIYAGSKSSGKALRDGTPILTDKGWFPIEKLKPGDFVFGKDGKQTEVTGVFPQGENECYRFIFSDHTTIDCDINHLWTVQTVYEAYCKKTGHKNKNVNFGKWRTISTKEILRYRTKKHPRLIFPLNQLVKFSHKQYNLDPYLLGVLLGDGCFAGGSSTPKISTADEEILNAFIKLGYKCNYDRGYDYRVLGIYNEINELGLKGLRSHEKFIPKNYLYGNKKTRLAVLQGLMDTDGSVSNNRSIGNFKSVEYCSASKMLAEDVAFLVRSLGGVAYITSGKTFYAYKGIKKEGKRRYRVRVRAKFQLFRLKRKAIINKIVSFKNRPHKKLKDVKYLGKHKTTCIKVDSPDGLFIAKDFIVTHNTALALETIRINKRKWQCIYHSSELNKQTFKRRLSRLNNFRLDEWREVKFVGSLVAETAMDRVQPGSLNIFDYVETDGGEYYKIPGYIAKIHRALGEGIALICLQKDTFKPYADGGEKTRQKANLYCILQPDFPHGQKLIINNCKAWKQEENNPAGFEINYKIVNGINIVSDGFLMPGLER